MFIEVYQIPTGNWTKPAKESVLDENRKCISVKGIRVRYSTKCAERAEILMPNGDIIHVVGSYDEIVERIQESAYVARVS